MAGCAPTSIGAGEKNHAEVSSLGYSGPCCWGVLESCELVSWDFKTSSVMFQIVTTKSNYECIVITNNRCKAPHLYRQMDGYHSPTSILCPVQNLNIILDFCSTVAFLSISYDDIFQVCDHAPQDYSSQLLSWGKTLSKSGQYHQMWKLYQSFCWKQTGTQQLAYSQ